jgi:hypothetical protein
MVLYYLIGNSWYHNSMVTIKWLNIFDTVFVITSINALKIETNDDAVDSLLE